MTDAVTSQPVETDLLTIPEAAEVLKVSAVTVSRYLKQGRLPAFRVGPRAVRIRRGDLDRLLTPTGPPVPGVLASAGPGGTMAGPAAEAASGAPQTASMSGDMAPDSAASDLASRAARVDERAARLAAIAEVQALRERIVERRRGVALPAAGAEIEKAREKRGKRA